MDGAREELRAGTAQKKPAGVTPSATSAARNQILFPALESSFCCVGLRCQ